VPSPETPVDRSPRAPSPGEALLPVICLVGFLGGNVLLLDGTPHVPLLLGAAVAALVGLRQGHSWAQLEEGVVQGISVALQACMILLVVGTLIGTWIVSGIVPTMIAYGLRVISPSVFLLTACLLCALVSLATGSSWSTAGTIGIALIGIGRGLGVPDPMVAGAVVSGAYLGDKMSPLSDTTNLAPAVAGTDLFSHVRHMVYTSLPSFLIALVIYGLLGLRYQRDALQQEGIDLILQTLQANFVLHPLLLLPPVLVIAMVILRVPALPALLAGALLGGLAALVAQDVDAAQVMAAAQSGYVSKTGVSAVDSLLSRGGMESMFCTVALIMAALSFGGIMERTGMMRVLAEQILSVARSRGTLVLATLCTCVGMNIVAPDQYLSIVVPGRMYRGAFARQGLHPKNLSRCLEDAGTLSSPLVPWNTCGAYMWATLGVYPLAYLPYAFVNLLNPLASALYGFTGYSMTPLDTTEAAPADLQNG